VQDTKSTSKQQAKTAATPDTQIFIKYRAYISYNKESDERNGKYINSLEKCHDFLARKNNLHMNDTHMDTTQNLELCSLV
jgi:hypothetical protein